MTSLSVNRLGVSRGRAVLVSDVSFSASGGEMIALVGPNGAGKSTLLRALAGLEKTAANISVNGAAIETLTPIERARRVAYLPQAREVNWAMTAEAVVSLGRFAYGSADRLEPEDRAAVERALAATDSASFRSRVASTLSGGEAVRIHLARALAAETPILLADEPIAALDLSHALSILETLAARARAGGLVIAAVHDLDLARRFASRILVLGGGRLIADGEPDAALNGELVERVFNVSHGPDGWRLAAPR